jgi:hypothetical protein
MVLIFSTTEITHAEAFKDISSAELDARQGPSSSLQAYSAVEAGTT